jgi:hypothetical protein
VQLLAQRVQIAASRLVHAQLRIERDRSAATRVRLFSQAGELLGERAHDGMMRLPM